MKRVVLSASLLLITYLTFYQPVYAHPGNTASDGCHYCRTNCSKWGVAWNARHCHGGYTPPEPTYTPPEPTYTPPEPICGTNAYLNGNNECSCKAGYTPAINDIDCIYLPPNAHIVENSTDVWLCNEGYIEQDDSCIKKTVPPKGEEKEVKGAAVQESTPTPPVAVSAEEDTGTGWMTLLLGLGGVYWLSKKLSKKKASKSTT